MAAEGPDIATMRDDLIRRDGRDFVLLLSLAAAGCGRALLGVADDEVDLVRPSSFAASTRPWPAMISWSSLIRTGLVKPKRSMEAAICLICFLEWVRALRANGRRFATGTAWMAVGSMVVSHMAEGSPGWGGEAPSGAVMKRSFRRASRLRTADA